MNLDNWQVKPINNNLLSGFTIKKLTHMSITRKMCLVDKFQRFFLFISLTVCLYYVGITYQTFFYILQQLSYVTI